MSRSIPLNWTLWTRPLRFFDGPGTNHIARSRYRGRTALACPQGARQ